jgi:hypothetical protein
MPSWLNSFPNVRAARARRLFLRCRWSQVERQPHEYAYGGRSIACRHVDERRGDGRFDSTTAHGTGRRA